MVCKLIIESLNDAQARCACGKWHFSGTGSRTRAHIRRLWEQHAFENLCRTYPCPSCRNAAQLTPVWRGVNGTTWCQCTVCHLELHPYFILGYYEAKEEILHVETDEQVQPAPSDRDRDPP